VQADFDDGIHVTVDSCPFEGPLTIQPAGVKVRREMETALTLAEIRGVISKCRDATDTQFASAGEECGRWTARGWWTACGRMAGGTAR
jgi:hypothetical protein